MPKLKIKFRILKSQTVVDKTLKLILLSMLVAVLSLPVFAQAYDKYKNQNIDGVYEFVSEEIKYSTPIAKSETLTNTEWKGIWIFHAGFFSSTLIKNKKSNEPLAIQTAVSNESTSGQYELSDNFITMKFPLSQSYFDLPPDVRKFNLTEDLLTLTKTYIPNLHSDVKGQSVLTLKRIKK